MEGFPRYLNSRKYYENIIEQFGCTEETRRAYQALLNTDKHYVFDRILVPNETPDGKEPEYKIVVEGDENEVEKRVQYKLVNNLNSKLKLLGFKTKEVIKHV